MNAHLAQQPLPKKASFGDSNDPDYTVNAVVYVVLLLTLVGVYFWRKKSFESAVDAAAAGKPVGVRAAYNQLWVWMALSAGLSAVVVVVSLSTNLKSFFMAG